MPIVVEQTITTSGVTSSDSLVAFNRLYLKTLDGLLKIGQVILGLVVLIMTVNSNFYHHFSWSTFLLLTSFCFCVVSFLMLASSVASLTGVTLNLTLFYLVYNITGFVFYLAGGLSVVISASLYSNLGLLIAAGVIGLITSAFYLVDAVITIRNRLQ